MAFYNLLESKILILSDDSDHEIKSDVYYVNPHEK